MSASSFISRRYFFGRKRMFASFLNIIAVLGVALGVFALVVVMSVMKGFSSDLQQKLMGFNAHVVIEHIMTPEINSYLDGLKSEVASSTEIIDGEGILETGPSGEEVQGVKIRGVGDSSHAILGDELAYQMDISEGDYITLIVPIGRISPSGEMLPQKKRFHVGDTLKSGYFEYDSKTVIVSEKDAKTLLGQSARPEVHIWLKDYRNSETVAAKMRQAFPEYSIFSWMQTNRKLFAALKLERIAMSALLVLIVAIASISIVSVILMYIFVRRKDIAILSSLGASTRQISSIFIKVGTYIGISGTILGMVIGIAVCRFLQHKRIELPSSYYLNHLPVIIDTSFLVTTGLCGVGLAILAAAYPAWVASKFKPIEMIRYE